MASELTNKLDNLLPSYYLNKTNSDQLKKELNKQNETIKQIMSDLVLSHYTDSTETFKATRSIQERSSMDEDILLAIISESDELKSIADSCGVIKTKEYIDFDALENAIYKEKLSKEQMLELNKAVSVKEVVTLRVTKVKKKEKD